MSGVRLVQLQKIWVPIEETSKKNFKKNNNNNNNKKPSTKQNKQSKHKNQLFLSIP